VRRETPLALYKGLGAVLAGIVPKMATRFASFEAYKGWLTNKETGKTSVGSIFIGLFLDSFSLISTPNIEFLLWNSRVGCRNNRGGGRGDTNGGSQDSTSSATTLSCRPIGSATLPKCRSCRVYHCSRGRRFRSVSWGISHCHQASYQPRYDFGFQTCDCPRPLTWPLCQE
jgi:hypothetical protein